MNAFVILSEAKDFTTGVSNTKRLARESIPLGKIPQRLRGSG
jgi:hypothetical protein